MLNEQQVAQLLNVNKNMVVTWRAAGIGPPAVKVGSQWGYFWSEFEAWRAAYSAAGGADTSSSPPSSATAQRKAGSPSTVSRAA